MVDERLDKSNSSTKWCNYHAKNRLAPTVSPNRSLRKTPVLNDSSPELTFHPLLPGGFQSAIAGSKRGSLRGRRRSNATPNPIADGAMRLPQCFFTRLPARNSRTLPSVDILNVIVFLTVESCCAADAPAPPSLASPIVLQKNCPARIRPVEESTMCAP